MFPLKENKRCTVDTLGKHHFQTLKSALKKYLSGLVQAANPLTEMNVLSL